MTNYWVQPCEKIPAQTIRLSITDAIAPKNWPIQLVFWPLENPDLFSQVYENLKEGIRRLLAEVPALAGSLTTGESNEDARILAITIPEDAGVEFAFEDLSSRDAVPSFDELQRTGFPTTGLKATISPRVSVGPLIGGSPTFCAKLNHLRGGVALVFSFGHAVADGFAVSLLTGLWAQHTKDASQGRPFRRLKPVTPDDEIRSRLSTPPKVEAGEALDSYLQIVSSEEAVSHLPRDAAAAEEAKQKVMGIMMGHLAATGQRPERRIFTMWKFTPEKLADLKQTASGTDEEARDWISTMDALAGLFWSRLAHHLGQGAEGHKKSTCVFSMSVRHRLQPPVPDAYIGNVFCPVGAECPLEELESDGEAGLRAAARSLRRANKDWNETRWNVWLNTIIALPPDQVMSVNWSVVMGKHNLRFNDYSKYQLNLSDWGTPLGRVASTRFFRSVHPGGALGIWVAPRLADGALEVSLMSDERLLQSLSGDALFTRYAEFVCQHA
jgi:trichothecene 3-O-acetyltransferase